MIVTLGPVTVVVDLRPTTRRAALIALGVGAPVVFAFLFLALALTDGSYWSYGWAAVGYLLAWLRATRVRVFADAESVTVHNFYGSTTMRRDEVQHVEPFSYWINPNFTCMALVASTKRKPMHATALANRQANYESEAQAVAARLGKLSKGG